MTCGRHIWLTLVCWAVACGGQANGVNDGAGAGAGGSATGGAGGSATGGAGSGATDAPASPPQVCFPGQGRTCSCGGGVDGVEYCNSAGTGYGSCQGCGTCNPSNPSCPSYVGPTGGAGGGPSADAGAVDGGIDAVDSPSADAADAWSACPPWLSEADAGVTLIATTKAKGVQLAQDDAAVYWMDEDTSTGEWEIDKYLKADGSITKVFASTGVVLSFRLVVAGGYVYHWAGSGVRRVSTAGGAASPQLVGGNAQFEPVFTATDAWAYSTSYTVVPEDYLQRACTADGGTWPSVQLPRPWWGANGLGADSQNVYVATNGYHCIGPCTGESATVTAPKLFYMPHGGSSVAELISLPEGSTGNVGITAVASNGAVVCAALGGISCRSLAAGASQFRIGIGALAIALDATHVYSDGQGRSSDVCQGAGLWRAGLSGEAGEAPMLIATGPAKSSDGSFTLGGGLTVDERYVYWTSGNQVLRMTKPP